LNAAHDLFSERGLEATRLEDVARRAHVSKGGLYDVADDKLDLFYQVCRLQFAHDLERLDQTLGAIDDPVLAFRALVMAMIPPAREAPGYYAIIFELAVVALRDKGFGEKVRDMHIEMRDRFRGHVSGLLRRGAERGAFRGDTDLDVLATMVHGWVDKLWIDWILIPSMTQEDIHDAARRFTDTLLGWIAVD
jgi:AcrR family transcriptional regulator